jgi:hypothetical protein
MSYSPKRPISAKEVLFMPLSNEDKAILELIEETNKQYENYLAISEAAAAIPEDIIEEPVYTWERPLTLVISRDR